jgi:hypothetical protein
LPGRRAQQVDERAHDPAEPAEQQQQADHAQLGSCLEVERMGVLHALGDVALL